MRVDYLYVKKVAKESSTPNTITSRPDSANSNFYPTRAEATRGGAGMLLETKHCNPNWKYQIVICRLHSRYRDVTCICRTLTQSCSNRLWILLWSPSITVYPSLSCSPVVKGGGTFSGKNLLQCTQCHDIFSLVPTRQ